MTLWRDEPPVEPLSEVSWRRIESRVFAELDRPAATVAPRAHHARRRWRPAWTLAACAAVAVIGLSVIANHALRAPAGDSGLELSRIVTADAPAEMTVGRAVLTVAPRSTLWVRTNDARGVEIMLEQGGVECAVAPHPERSRFVVQAGDVRVEVVGTRFVVARDGDSARVAVTRGEVVVFHQGERTEVLAGGSWPRDQDEAQGRGGREREHSGAASGSEREAEPAPVEEPAEPGDADRAPESREPGARAETARGARAGNEREVRAGNEREVRARRDEERGRAAKPAASARDRALYERAARLEASDPAAALALYRQIAEQGGSWTAIALFAQARLELELGNRDTARALLRSYLRRFPAGANAADARELLRQP